MNSLLNIDTWKRQLETFLAAPYIIGPIVLVVAIITWWFRGHTLHGAIAGLREQIAVSDERIKLAAEKAALANEAKDDLERQLQELRAAITANSDRGQPNAILAAIIRIDTALQKLSGANSEVISVLSGRGGLGPRWCWDQNRPEAIAARREAEEFHRRIGVAHRERQASQAAQRILAGSAATHFLLAAKNLCLALAAASVRGEKYSSPVSDHLGFWQRIMRYAWPSSPSLASTATLPARRQCRQFPKDV
jgi:hypothetical protein